MSDRRAKSLQGFSRQYPFCGSSPLWNLPTVLMFAVSALGGAPVPNSKRVPPPGAKAQSVAPSPKALNKEDSVESLRARLQAHISQPRFNSAFWGIKVVDLSSGKTVFEQNATKYFTPASNAKLFTAALALDKLGPDYRIKTSLYSGRRPEANGTLRGDLLVYGRGDPSISAAFNGGDYQAGLEPLAAALKAAGVRRVTGDLVGDQSYFRGAPFGAGWGWDDLQWYYGAEVSALSINDNAVDLSIEPAEREGRPCRITVGPATALIKVVNRTQTASSLVKRSLSIHRPVGENVVYVSGQLPVGDSGYTGHIAVHHPAQLFVTLFREVLRRHGIIITGKVRTVDWLDRESSPFDPSRLVKLGAIESHPLAEIVGATLKSSQNLYAQLLLLQVGSKYVEFARDRQGRPENIDSADGRRLKAADRPEQKQAGSLTTEEAGIEEMRTFLEGVNGEGARVLLEEGAGLSRRDEVTADSIVRLLVYMRSHKAATIFMDALPVAGVDGTLLNRMKGTPAAGNVRAKTGALRYANALSGYVTTAGGEALAFSLLLNNYNPADKAAAARDELDSVAVILASFAGHISQ